MADIQETEKTYILKVNGKVVGKINDKKVSSITINGKKYKIK